MEKYPYKMSKNVNCSRPVIMISALIQISPKPNFCLKFRIIFKNVRKCIFIFHFEEQRIHSKVFVATIGIPSNIGRCSGRKCMFSRWFELIFCGKSFNIGRFANRVHASLVSDCTSYNFDWLSFPTFSQAQIIFIGYNFVKTITTNFF